MQMFVFVNLPVVGVLISLLFSLVMHRSFGRPKREGYKGGKGKEEGGGGKKEEREGVSKENIQIKEPANGSEVGSGSPPKARVPGRKNAPKSAQKGLKEE